MYAPTVKCKMADGDDIGGMKWILIIVMFLLTMLAGLVPVKVLKHLRHSAANAKTSMEHKHFSLVLCLLTCFSGGVFLATCFLHLFPELLEKVESFKVMYNVESDFPLAELIACLGFFLLFFLEEVVIMAIPSMAHSHGHGHGLETDPADESGCCMTNTSLSTTQKRYESPEKNVSFSHDGTQEAMLSATVEDEEAAGHCQKHCPLTVHRVSGRESPECRGNNDVFTPVAVAEPERCETNCERVNEDPPILMKSSPHAHSHGVRSVTLVLALSFHSVIEGIALGVAESKSAVLALFMSLMIHKLIVAFSVGLQLARTHAHQLKWVVLSMVILSSMSPFGGILGIIIQDFPQSMAKDMVITIAEGLAVGTFLYVTFFEVLLHERDNEHPNLLKLLLIMIGFALIGLIRLVAPHVHNDGGHDLGNVTSSLHAEVLGHGHSHD